MSQPTQTTSWAALQVWPEVRAHCAQHRVAEQGQPRATGKRDPPGTGSDPVMATEQGSGGPKSTVHPRSD